MREYDDPQEEYIESLTRMIDAQAAEIARLRTLLTRVIAHDDRTGVINETGAMPDYLRRDIDAAIASTDTPKEEER